ncbi:hypothetical protein HYE82_18830 [Streptomyces sp. BR123]|uniref:hypothetical protein n=1 Tax=Streptomyces sp. BR123 TaxID=2749828 RepID=UPI0015C47081|nr:hypothetical protein [Streptomyces sp. BR123]NXY96408.1 hypothetical protein [Streptomyces sp. BR123]
MTRKPLPPHGTINRRKHHGCKCQDCCEALRAYSNARYAAIAAGTWQPFVEAEPVRRHILRLRAAGMSFHRIQVLSGLPNRTITGFLAASTGPGNVRCRKRNTRREVADKILSIPVDPMMAHLVDATGTQRRIQALAAIGWPQKQLAARVGLNRHHMGDILKRKRVLNRTAIAVAEAYEGLKSGSSLRYGVSKTNANRARAQAAANRWAPPKYWDRFPDAIDDPHFTPEYKVTKAEILAEETAFLVTVAGLTRAQAAERLGKDKTYIDRVLGQQQLREAA